jgi:hypothetical protein
VVDHFQAIAEDVNFRFDTGAVQRFTDIFKRFFASLTTFRLTKNVDPHSDPPSFRRIKEVIITFLVIL